MGYTQSITFFSNSFYKRLESIRSDSEVYPKLKSRSVARIALINSLISFVLDSMSHIFKYERSSSGEVLGAARFCFKIEANKSLSRASAPFPNIRDIPL